MKTTTDSVNIGWTINDNIMLKLEQGDSKIVDHQSRQLVDKLTTGRGYHVFTDKANRLSPQMYKDRDAKVITSQLCSEIFLTCDEERTFTCVLSSLNMYKYDEWKDKGVAFIATVFLDCVAEEFIKLAENIPGLEKAVKFTKESRALGLGVLGMHSYLQSKMLSFSSLQSQFFNVEFSKLLNEESLEASKFMAEFLGEPEWCVGYRVRNTHRLAYAPTKSTGLIMGGASEGINPDPGMIFQQPTTVGEIPRVVPELLKLMKSKNVYNKKNLKEIEDAVGSVQNVDWLTDEEKLVFRTAFEIDQNVVIRYASLRQRNIDQGQSLNLFFSANTSEEYIREVHQAAWRDPYILSLYYIYSSSDSRGASQNVVTCEACQ